MNLLMLVPSNHFYLDTPCHKFLSGWRWFFGSFGCALSVTFHRPLRLLEIAKVFWNKLFSIDRRFDPLRFRRNEDLVWVC